MSSEQKIGFLEEAPGVQSSMRLAFLSLIATGILGCASLLICGLIKYMHGNETLGIIVTAASSFLVAISSFASALKLVQKNQENNSSTINTPG